MSSEFRFEKISDKYTDEIKNKSVGPNQSNPDLIVHPSGCVMPSGYEQACQRIYDFEVFPDDTWVVTFPKSGTTWSQEMVWLLRNNLDFEEAKRTMLIYRVPFIELEGITSFMNEPHEAYMNTIDMCKNLTRPRTIKSHLPVELLPKQLWTVKPKIVYVCRDPRDVVISYYHHYRLFNTYKGTLDDFIDVFLNDRIVYGPYWEHAIGFRNKENESHILFNSYEEMKKNLSGVIRKTAEFLGVEVTEDQVQALKEHLSFEKMKDNDSCNLSFISDKRKKDEETDENLNFIRKGQTGGWKNTLSMDVLEKFQEWDERHLKDQPFKEYIWTPPCPQLTPHKSYCPKPHLQPNH